MPQPGVTSIGPRVLLRQIREVMASDAPVQARLDQVVKSIARLMVTEVCSVYLLRSTGDMELFATQGLNPDAVHRTRLKPGEGLVGEVVRTAAPVSLSDAPAHPSFSYRPETGEDPYSAFLGVPLLRGGRVVGVLVVQNQTSRAYAEDEVEDLQTIAMVLAEVVAGVEDAIDTLGDVEVSPHRPERLKGQRFADGLALGQAVLHDPPIPAAHIVADDPVAEEARLQDGLSRLRQQIDDLLSVSHLSGPSIEVLETYRMFADDRGWVRSLEEAVRGGLSAEAAVDRARTQHRARFAAAKDPYIRERLHDLEDLANRLLRVLAGEETTHRDLPDNAILVARNLGPADLLEYPPGSLKGLLLEEGSAASHAALVARALEIPCVGRLAALRDHLSEGDIVIVDGETAEAHLRPRADVIEAARSRLAVRAALRANIAELREKPAVTRDGARITLLTNAGLVSDMAALDATGADGIGLFRTEFQFMVQDRLPGVEAQTALYTQILDEAAGRPVTFRTLDIGGDKVVSFLQEGREENPALGRRSIRLGLDRPPLLRLQLRALLRAAQGRELRVMFPLIASVDEFAQARDLVDLECDWALRRGWSLPSALRIGAMIEAPALLWHLDALLPQTDFVSVGTNDLMQYMFAADRTNPMVADRYDTLSPPFLNALARIQAACAESGTPVSVCGEMAGRPLEAFALIALGYQRLSAPAAGVGLVKRMILSLDVARAQKLFQPLLLRTSGSVRGEIETLARKLNLSL